MTNHKTICRQRVTYLLTATIIIRPIMMLVTRNKTRNKNTFKI